MIGAVRRVVLLLPLACLLLGLVFELRARVDEAARLDLVVGEGTFWRIEPDRGLGRRATDVARVGGRLLLPPDAVLRLAGETPARVEFEALPTRTFGRVVVRYRASDHAIHGFEVEPRRERRVVHRVESLEDRARFGPGCDFVREERILDAAALPVGDVMWRYVLSLGSDATTLEVGGVPLASGPPAYGDVELAALGADLALASLERTAEGGVVDRADVAGLASVPAPAVALEAAVPLAALFAVTAALLAALAAGRPTPWQVLFATLVALAPFHVGVAARALGWVPLDRFLLLASPLALVPALFVLRASLRPAAGGDSIRRRLAGALASLLVVGGVATWRVHDEAGLRELDERRAVAWERSRAPDVERLVPTDEVAVGGFTLDRTNAEFVSGSFRDFDLQASVVLSEGALLEVRSRAERGAALGIAAFVSADPSFASGLYLEAEEAFEPLGVAPRVAPAPAGRPLDVSLFARGDWFELRVGDAAPVVATCDRFPRGGFAFLAARGTAEMRGVTVTPRPAAPVDRWEHARRTIAAGSALFLLWIASALLVVLLTRSPLSIALPPAAFVAVPPAAAVGLFATRGAAPPAVAAWAVALAVLPAVLLAAIHGRRRSAWRILAVIVLVGSAAALALRASTFPVRLPEAPWERTAFLNARTFVDGATRAMPADHLHLVHPLVRRFNGYLADHRFRGRVADPAEDAPRVVALGSSSTFGYLLPEGADLDYPARLQERLQETWPDAQVWNAAWSGATLARVTWFFRDVIVPLRPDVVTLSLYYNDAVVLSQGDEAAWYDRLVAGAAPSSFEVFAARADIQRERAVLEEARRRFDERREGSLDCWVESGGDPEDHPAARFERGLRRFVALAKEAGIEVVLIKEAVAGNRPLLWKDEFRASLDRVAADEDVIVCDPTYVLLQGERRLPEPLFMDEVHLHPAGCDLMAWSLRPHVEEALTRARGGRR